MSDIASVMHAKALGLSLPNDGAVPMGNLSLLEAFANRFLDPEDLGYSVSAYTRDQARVALGRPAVESVLQQQISQPPDPPVPSTTIKYFEYSHFPERLKIVSKPIGELAHQLEAMLPDGPEKSAGMRKLLEAKDCFVRAALEPTSTPKS